MTNKYVIFRYDGSRRTDIDLADDMTKAIGYIDNHIPNTRNEVTYIAKIIREVRLIAHVSNVGEDQDE